MVSFFSLKSDSAPPWMVLAVLWCSMAQTLLLPSFIWSCERYRADVRTVWEQCVAIMSEEDGEDGQKRDRAFFLGRRLPFLPLSTSSSRCGDGLPGVPPAGRNLRCPWADSKLPFSQSYAMTTATASFCTKGSLQGASVPLWKSTLSSCASAGQSARETVQSPNHRQGRVWN